MKVKPMGAVSIQFLFSPISTPLAVASLPETLLQTSRPPARVTRMESGIKMGRRMGHDAMSLVSVQMGIMKNMFVHGHGPALIAQPEL